MIFSKKKTCSDEHLMQTVTAVQVKIYVYYIKLYIEWDHNMIFAIYQI